ncbi:MAG: hypothetical protein R6U57_07650 [Anaerolineales bacterium]
MKNRYVLLLAIGLLAVGLFGVTQVYAQEPTPGAPTGTGMGPRRFGHDNAGTGDGLLHEYMTEAISDVFGISPDELDEIHESGDTLWQTLDLTIEEFRSKMTEVRQTALENAAEDGVISQDQVDWMLERMNGAGKGQHGPGDGSCLDGEGNAGAMHGGRGGRGMGRW